MSSDLSVDLGIPQTPDNTTDPMMYAEFMRVYNSVRAVASALDSYTGNSKAPLADMIAKDNGEFFRLRQMDCIYATVSMDLPAGAAVHCWYDATNKKWDVQLATATNAALFCNGFCVTDKGVTAGSIAKINMGGGLIPYIGSLVDGTTYYLSETPGYISASATGSGRVITQKLGYAIGPTYFYFTPNPV